MFYSKTTGGFYSTEIHGESIPVDAVVISDEAYRELLSGQAGGGMIVGDENGYPRIHTPSGPTNEEAIAFMTNAVQQHLDSTARSRGYDSIISLCSYAGSTNARFAAEGQAGVVWRDAVWTSCIEILADVTEGRRPAPTVESLLGELPQMVWPE